METHAPPRDRMVLLVAFALICLGLTVAAYVSFGGSAPFAPLGYQVKLPLPNADTLVAGSDVDIAGVKIGRVVSIQRRGNGALATLSIAPQYVPLRTGATAIVRTKTLLGESYIEMAPGPRAAPPLRDGAQLALSQVRTAVTLDEFLGAFSPSARATTRDLFAGLAGALSGRGQALNSALGRAAPVTENLEAVFRTLSGETPQLQNLFASGGTVLNALGRRQGDLRAAVAAGNAVLNTTAARNRQLAAAVRALPPFLGQLRRTSQAITADSGDLNRAVIALEPVSGLLTPVLSDVNEYAPQFRSLFNRLPATTAAGKQGLPALTQILTALPNGLNQLYPTSQQLIPFAQLLATYREPSLIAALANGSSAFNGTLVGAGGKMEHRASGALYVSNETVVGGTKRLPTNRSNPYPTPTGLSKLAAQGFLDSYDCRNLNNILYLPPIGTGVPPCVTQGPWSYDGINAYYPRLQPTP